MMKLRHAAALALVGWYLMVPMLDKATGEVQSKYPLFWWSTSASFDTAVACTEYRRQRLNTEEKQEAEIANHSHEEQRCYFAALDKNLGWPSGTAQAHSHAGSEMYRASLCISSDDPRLKGAIPRSAD
jgi:hypothetical protein